MTRTALLCPRRDAAPDEIARPLDHADWIGRAGGLIGLTTVVALMALAACSPEDGGQADARKGPAAATRPEAPASAAAPQQDIRAADVAIREAGAMSRTERSGAAPPMSGASGPAGAPMPTWPGADRFESPAANGYVSVAEQPVSTFSTDVDTASYALMRRFLRDGATPPPGAVRLEEMVNYFPYAYPAPVDRDQPFRVTTTLMPSPWHAERRILHIGLRGYDLPAATRPRANIVLLVDVSGSMAPGDRLPLLKRALRMLVDELRAGDRMAIVTYASGVATVLEPTDLRDKPRVLAAIDDLTAAGGTNGGDGIQRAYALAERHFDKDGVNRVVLATDGDFNVGITDPRALQRFVADRRKAGIYLSVFGVGLGNHNDALMQRLAQVGNGNAAYLDSLLEARKAFKESFASTMFTIADDVKVQVEFNPAFVAGYRLLGYESRMLKREDFNDDAVDAGDVGAGHSVTAIYEITPVGASGLGVDPLRYGDDKPAPAAARHGDELAFVKLRYKLPGERTSRMTAHPVRMHDTHPRIEAAPGEQRFALAVAMFAERLRGTETGAAPSYGAIARLAAESRGDDPDGHRSEFIRLVRMAETMTLVGQR